MCSLLVPDSDAMMSICAGGKAKNDVMPHTLHIDRRGVWSCNGSPFLRKEMVCLLASCLSITETGNYEVTIPGEAHSIPVEVEDVPFLAVELFCSGCGIKQILSFRTNVDRVVSIGPDFPLYVASDPETGENVPYVSLGNGLAARLSRPVFYELFALAKTHIGQDDNGKEREEVGVWSHQKFFVLGNLT